MDRRRMMATVLAGGASGWSVAVNSFPQSYGAELLLNAGYETGDPPSSWTAVTGAAASEAEERTGGSGTKSARFTLSSTSGTLRQVVTVAVGDFVEWSGWIKSPLGKQIAVFVVDGTFTDYGPSGTPYTGATWAKLVGGIRRASSTSLSFRNSIGGVSTDYALYDDSSMKKITLNPQTNLPSADAQIEVDCVLPISANRGDGFYLYYRIDGTLSSTAKNWRIEITRNISNTLWEMNVYTVNDATETLVRTVADIGIPDGFRVKCIGNEHRFYTHQSGFWSQQGAAVTNTWNNDKVGCNVITMSGTTITALRGSLPLPFDYGLSGDNYYFIHGDSKSTIGKWDWQFKPFAEEASHERWNMAANIAVGGWSVWELWMNIDAQLAAIPATPTPKIAMLNFGANSIGVAPPGDEALYKSYYWYACDAIHTKWPGIKIYLMTPWKQGYPANTAIIAAYTASVVAGRDFIFDGPDERIFIENGDNGTTYTNDGTHPNTAGYTLTSHEWVSKVIA